MASDKRERQRQNRAVKQQELNKVQRKQKTIATIKRVGVWIVIAVVMVVLANLVFG
jgi:cell division protein FtsL